MANAQVKISRKLVQCSREANWNCHLLADWIRFFFLSSAVEKRRPRQAVCAGYAISRPIYFSRAWKRFHLTLNFTIKWKHKKYGRAVGPVSLWIHHHFKAIQARKVSLLIFEFIPIQSTRYRPKLRNQTFTHFMARRASTIICKYVCTNEHDCSF